MTNTNPDVIPDDIANFIAERIGSVAELEGLLILRQDPRMRWSPQVLASRLYLTESDAEDLLQLLCRNGFAVNHGGQPPLFSYSPASAEIQSAIDRLADLYSAQLVAVSRLIHSKEKPRVQGFADAFRFRRDDK